ncbi:MAG: hypothetical protein ACXADY_02830 [Candidatus Hodarchaeales archaeon]|jgi:hypothetical protein
MENWKNLLKSENILLCTVMLIVILTGIVFFTVDFANESSVRRAELTLDIVPIFLTIALTLVVLSSQWTRSEEKEKKQKEEKRQKIRERAIRIFSLEVKANLKMFENVGAARIKFKLLDEILKLIINSGDIIYLEQDLQEDILNFRPEISLFNQTVFTSAEVSTTTRNKVLGALKKFETKLEERLKQL